MGGVAGGAGVGRLVDCESLGQVRRGRECLGGDRSPRRGRLAGCLRKWWWESRGWHVRSRRLRTRPILGVLWRKRRMLCGTVWLVGKPV